MATPGTALSLEGLDIIDNHVSGSVPFDVRYA